VQAEEDGGGKRVRSGAGPGVALMVVRKKGKGAKSHGGTTRNKKLCRFRRFARPNGEGETKKERKTRNKGH